MLSPPPKKYDIIIASSHYLTDVLPAVYLKSKNPSSRFIAYYLAALVSERSVGMFLLRKASDALSVPLLRKYADLTFALNDPIRDFLIAHRVKKSKILVTDCGIDAIARDEGPETPVFDACFVGRLEKGKGVFDLVAIWKAVSSKIPTAKLAVMGDGSEKDRLTELIERENLAQNIVLCGFVEEEKKFDNMRRSKLLLLPSSVDAWGIVVAEAMSYGVPAIVYDVPAFRAVWGSSVAYAPAGDIRAFAEVVLGLLQDPARRSELTQRGLKRVSNLLWIDVARREADAIEST